MRSSQIHLRPIKLAEAKEFVREHHRHNAVPVGWLWGHGLCDDEGVLRGVATVGRPIAWPIDDGLTIEVTRLCTDGVYNGCSKLYAAARKAALAKGYRRGLTYIRDDEDGASLRAAGWNYLWPVRGRKRSCKSRPRQEVTEIIDRHAYGWGAWKELIPGSERTRASQEGEGDG